MKAKELMIGDWVMPHNCTSPSIVAGVTPNKVHTWWADGTKHAKDEYYFDPIPLTPEILEKNGLDKVPELSMVLNRDTMPMYHSPMLHYVHELQHALRLCGLNDLADNFKV